MGEDNKWHEQNKKTHTHTLPDRIRITVFVEVGVGRW